MKDLYDWLKEGDPVASEPPLTDAEVQRMRQAVVAASDEPQRFFADWARGSWAAVTVMVALTIAAGVHRWFTPLPETRGSDVRAVSSAAAPAPGERRQVQLIAPGGTRVIWIFNADFQQ
jgi:hypothetical protein